MHHRRNAPTPQGGRLQTCRWQALMSWPAGEVRGACYVRVFALFAHRSLARTAPRISHAAARHRAR
eukprot:scaffold12001_cov116-Isochrysis_galbana.AAC.3